MACSERFTDADDVVVCPECGTPHHRLCYAEKRGCVNASRHSESYEWRSRIADLIDALEARESSDGFRNGGEPDSPDCESRDIYGVSKAELAAFMEIPMGSRAYQTQIAGRKTISVNVFAGLFTPFYQFYKGMRLLGALLTLPMFLTSAAEVLFFNEAAESNFLTNLVVIAEMVFVALFHDYIYLRFCAYKIKKIRRLFPEGGAEYFKELRERGKPRILRALADTLVVTLFLTVTAYFIYFLTSNAGGRP